MNERSSGMTMFAIAGAACALMSSSTACVADATLEPDEVSVGATQPLSFSPVTKTLTGTIGATTVPVGENWRIVGDLTLTGDLTVRGTLSAREGARIHGKGHQIVFEGSTAGKYMGRADFDGGDHGPRWTHADGRALPVGWGVGATVVAAPYRPGQRTPEQITLGTALPKLTYSRPDTGAAVPTELVRVDSRILVEQVSRMHFHVIEAHGFGEVAPTISGCPCPSYFREVAIVDGGDPAKGLGFYPLHFHRVGENVRGSEVTQVLMNRGKHHAFVTHASHGVTYRQSVALDTAGDSWWWDVTDGERGIPDASSASNDIFYDRVGTLGQLPSPIGQAAEPRESTAMLAAHGKGNKSIGAWVSGSRLGRVPNASAAHWSGKTNSFDDTWTWDDFVVHNVDSSAIFIWQNHTGFQRGEPHFIRRMISTELSGAAVKWGAYNLSSEPFHFVSSVLDGDVEMHMNGVNTKSEDHSTVEDSYVRRVLIPRHSAQGRIESATVRPSWEFVRTEIAQGISIDEALGGRAIAGGTGRFSASTRGGKPLVRTDFAVKYIHPSSRFEVWSAPWGAGTRQFIVE